MQQIVYAIHFHGRVAPAADNTNVREITAEAASASITSVVNDGGLTGGFDPAAVVRVHFESRAEIAGENRFSERGVMTVGSSTHTFRFASADAGHLEVGPEGKGMQGWVTFRIENGEGQFNGAQGIITSNFSVTEDGELDDYQVGVVYLK